VRLEAKFQRLFKLSRVVQSRVQKFFAFVFSESCFLAAVPTQYEGRTRRHEREAGCGGRGSVARRAALFSRTAKPCGPGAPMQVPSFSNLPRGDGDNKARSHRGEHGI